MNINNILVKTGLAAREREHNRMAKVLFYHGVSDTKFPFVEDLHISPKLFRMHLDYLQRYYEVISIDEYYDRWNTGTFTHKEITLTFDDGYRNNLTIAAPILKELGLPFTVFISTRHIDTGKRFPTFIGRAISTCPVLSHLRIPEIGVDCRLTSINQRKNISKVICRHLKHSDIKKVEQIADRLISHLSPEEYRILCDKYQADSVMTWQEVTTLQKQYNCTIGSHCLDHFICNDFQEISEIQRQIIESKKIIEEKLGSPCHYFAYPNGDYCPTALEAVRLAGYRLAFTTANQRLSSATSPLAMPRHGVRFNLNDFIVEIAYKPR